MYGIGYKQKRIKELGEQGKLMWKDMVLLYGGVSNAMNELGKLNALGLVNTRDKVMDVDTKITWLGKKGGA